MKLFHTSPEKIAEIKESGRYGEFLCFSDKPYSMSPGDVFVYSAEVSEEEIVEAGEFFYREDSHKLSGLVERVMDLVDCDQDTAEELLSQRCDVNDMDTVDPEDAAELSWDIQALTAKAAKLLGYRAVSMRDEQGTCYMVDLLGKESEMVLEGVLRRESGEVEAV